MTIPSPLQSKLEQLQVEYEVEHKETQREGAASGQFQPQLLSEFLPWGDGGCNILATVGIVELEYAAIHKSVGVFDAACRGTIELSGKDRLDCMNRLSTQQLLDMKEGESKLTFITSRKGAVLADAIVHAMRDKVLIDVDITAVESLIDHINSYIVMEDVQVTNATGTNHWLWVFGPQRNTINLDVGFTVQLPKDFFGIEGFAIALEPSEVVSTWNSIVDQGARPIGWYALNMARIEQGAPIFMIDFDQHNLPHETSLIQSRVRFDKGCYLGQEIVARMESLGQPKKRLVELRMDTDELPVAGSQLWEDETGSGTPIGVVTSSAISPLSGGVPLLIAMVGKKHAIENAAIYTYVGPEIVSATIIELHRSMQEKLS
jgi:folate-binding protein YgfZ